MINMTMLVMMIAKGEANEDDEGSQQTKHCVLYSS